MRHFHIFKLFIDESPSHFQKGIKTKDMHIFTIKLEYKCLCVN